MRKVSDKEREKLSAEIAGLESLDLNQLRVQWKLLYEIEAPPHLSQDWLMRAVAYRIQENVLGGLKPATRRLLERVAEDARVRKPTKVMPTRRIGPNTILRKPTRRTSMNSRRCRREGHRLDSRQRESSINQLPMAESKLDRVNKSRLHQEASCASRDSSARER